MQGDREGGEVSAENRRTRRLDPVVEEVRSIRRKLWAEADNRVDRFIENLDRIVPWDKIKQGRTPPPSSPEPQQ